MEPSQIHTFDFKELATLMVKARNIHTGHWAIAIRFAIAAANIEMKAAENAIAPTLLPTAMVPVTEIGLQHIDEPNELSVNAAKVNPKSKKV